MGKLFSLLCVFLCIFNQVLSNKIYVSTTGSSQGCGDITLPCDSIRTALSIAQNNDVISLLNGTYTGEDNRDLTIEDSIITIQVDNGEWATIDLQEQGRAFVISQSNVTISGIQFINGYVDTTITNSTGSVIASTSSVLVVENCVFTNNSASPTPRHLFPAGVINVVNSTYVKFLNSQFINNKIIDSKSHNEGFGGALYLENANVIIEGCHFERNGAYNGGAVFLTESFADISKSTFYLNVAGNAGGDIELIDNYLTNIEDTTFIGGNAFTGGSISSESSSFICTRCKIQHSTAYYVGGGISFSSHASGILINSTIDSCNATSYYGGGVYATYNSVFRATDVQITNNIADNNGGGIYLGTYAVAYLTRTVMSGNSAFNGGGLFLEIKSDIHMTKVSVEDNEADQIGGGLYCSNSRVFINQSTIQDNEAPADSDISCATSPAYTFCQFIGESNWEKMCGDQTTGENTRLIDKIKNLPPLAIVGIALSSAAVLFFIIACVVFIRFRKQLKNKESAAAVWKKIGTTKPDAEDMELLEDYDDDQS